MKLSIEYDPVDASAEIPGRLIQVSEKVRERNEQLLREHMLEIVINDVPTWDVVCSPVMLPELVLGRMLSEGIIRGTADVEQLNLCKDGTHADVLLKHETTARQAQNADPEIVSTCSAGTRNISELFSRGQQPEMLRPIPYQKAWIRKLVAVFADGTPLYCSTHCSHSAFLMKNGEILVRAEDIGRHNALDKAFGWAMLHEIPLGSCIIFTSGRIPVDMTMKVIRAGAPVLVSKAQPTDRAVELAQKYNLTMIGGAHEDSFRIYHGPDPADT